MAQEIEVKCPKCGGDMKEWVLQHRCRNLKCRLVIRKVFPPTGAQQSLSVSDDKSSSPKSCQKCQSKDIIPGWVSGYICNKCGNRWA